MKRVDVAIIGGGLSGLYSAYQLEQAGLSCTLFEAKERLGGRILSQPCAGAADLAVDLGPTWFWPQQQRMQRLLKALDIPSFIQYSRGETLYQFHRDVPPQHFIAADSTLSYRLRGGMQRLIDSLAQRLVTTEILLGHPVNKVQRSCQHWQITAESAETTVTVESSHLLLAAPPRVLLDKLSLSVWLPATLQKRLAATPTWMAGQAKFVATYARPFWREAGLAGAAFSSVGPLMEIHDASADADAGYALFGFSSLPAEAREEISAEAFTTICLRQLGELFGADALHPLNSYLKDWARDPWVATDLDRNEPSIPPALDLAPFKVELAKLKLGFAGTEVAGSEAGLLEGALLAAESAVTEIVIHRDSVRQGDRGSGA